MMQAVMWAEPQIPKDACRPEAKVCVPEIKDTSFIVYKPAVRDCMIKNR
jgi:hypothetical protein